MKEITPDQERTRREELWAALTKRVTSSDHAPPAVLNELKIFYGGRGIWVDKAETAKVKESPHGITVGLLHSGTAYADDLFEDGAIYHYPQTQVPGRDRAEIEATKAAARLRLPIFFTIRERLGAHRQVKRAWVEEWDDAAKQFLVTFGQPALERPQSNNDIDNRPFVLTAQRDVDERRINRSKRSAKFKFDVLSYYGEAKCCLCNIAVHQMLDAAHIVDVSHGGTDDKRNGLILCASHHRAYDAHLFAVEPGTWSIQAADAGLSLPNLGIVHASLSYLKQKPHKDAIEWRWTRWQTRHATLAQHSDPDVKAL